MHRLGGLNLQTLAKRTVPDLLDRSRRFGDGRPLVVAVSPERAVTYGEFLERAAHTATDFARRLAPGSRVACLLGNGLDYLILRYALSCAGLVEVAVNGGHRGEVLRHMLELSRPDAVVVGDEFRGNLDGCGFDLRGRWICGEVELGEIAASRSPWESRPGIAIDPGDCCRILFTSGTGGRSKAVELSHAYEVFTGHRHVDLVPIGPGDRMLFVTPLFHIDAVYIVSLLLHTGATLALASGFSLSRFWDDVRRTKASHLSYVGSIIAILLKGDGPLEAHTLRIGTGGGARPHDAREFEARFGVEILESYAMTECIACTFNPRGQRRSGSIGRAVQGYEVAIHGANGQAVPSGGMGEIVVRSDEPFALFTRYVGDPDATRTAMRGGWFHTGDLGSKDADGYFTYRGRLKDSIRVKGENVSALELEAIVDSHPDIQASAAIAVPSEIGDDDILLYIEPKPGAILEPRDVFAFVATRAVKFMWPRYIRISARLPRTATEKIMKSALDRSVAADIWSPRRSDPAEDEEHPGQSDGKPAP